MTKKIAFEAQLLLKGNKTGIGWCADNLIRGLLKEPSMIASLITSRRGVRKTSSWLWRNIRKQEQD